MLERDRDDDAEGLRDLTAAFVRPPTSPDGIGLMPCSRRGLDSSLLAVVDDVHLGAAAFAKLYGGEGAAL